MSLVSPSILQESRIPPYSLPPIIIAESRIPLYSRAVSSSKVLLAMCAGCTDAATAGRAVGLLRGALAADEGTQGAGEGLGHRCPQDIRSVLLRVYYECYI